MQNKTKNIIMKNCNCIKEASISIQPSTLNIKYGSNGTGKSTVSRAIYLKSKNDVNGLMHLRPYNIDLDNTESFPEIEGVSYSTVRVFDDSYVNSYLFNKDSFLDNSYRVFLRSDECDNLKHDIESMLSGLQGIFQRIESLKELRALLPKYFNAVNCSDGELTKKGGVGEFVKGNGAGFDNHKELENYRPFYFNRDLASVSKWAKWRNDGTKQMIGVHCPFCTNELEMDKIDEQNKSISKVFKNSALSTASAILEYLQEALEFGYVTNESVSELKSYIGNACREDCLFADLQLLAIETDYLISKIDKILNFRPMNVTHNQLSDIETNLDDMIIDMRFLSHFYTTDPISNLSNEVQNKIFELKSKTNILKGLFTKHEAKIGNLIQEKRDDINHFLSLAGFPYKFIIKPDGENKAISYLIPADAKDDNRISEPEKHLSWGEKNAFALVMFMFEATSDNADLIVLDDPITSFDKDKKFAVVRRLFDNQKASFRDKTVIMFTHDLQPIIDYIYCNFFQIFGLTTPVKAQWLQNENGLLEEYDIKNTDLLNTVDLTAKIAKDDTKAMAVRVVNLRKHLEIVKPSFSETPLYEVISNLIHGRNAEEINPSILSSGCEELTTYLGNKSYTDILNELTIDKLIALVKSDETYSKIIAIRLFFERHPGLCSKLRKKHPSAYKYINETNHVENDYIFQLNPFKFFNIPRFYLDQLEKLIITEKNWLCS